MKHESLKAYFEHQQTYKKRKKDTMKDMAKRHGLSLQTIWRARNDLPISYGLAKELSEEYGIKISSFTIGPRPNRAKDDKR